MKNITFITTLLLALAFGQAKAQTDYTVEKGSEMTVAGTSTLHDWEMKASEVEGKATLMVNGQGLEAIRTLTITVPVKSLESGKNSMDKNAYEALKADKHPTIRFEMKGISAFEGKQVIATGELTIGGKTRTVSVKAKYELMAGGKIRFTGAVPLDMTHYDVEPPSFMMGAVKTGEEVAVKFNVTFAS